MAKSLNKQMLHLAIRAHEASQEIAILSSVARNRVLLDVARMLRKNWKAIHKANQEDLKLANSNGLSLAMKDRLKLDQPRIMKMASAVDEVAKLKDPVGRTLSTWRRPNGLKISKMSVPLGTILIIYESRPNVTSECASLCLKSGNAVILRGGKEAFHSNQIIAKLYRLSLRKHKIPEDAVTLIETLDRDAIDALLKLDSYVNLVIPRGGEALIRRVAEHSRIPVIKHYKGICHVYIDRDANLDMAFKIAFNAKCQRVSVCNAMETLLVHQSVAKRFLPAFADTLRKADCEIRADQKARAIIPDAMPATEEDWKTEYLDKILSIRVVNSVDQAIEHIQKYGSAHTDAIVTQNKKTARLFAERVDSSSVMINTTTRFADGNEYGFGAEIGISTDKIHARGPMGLEGLTSYKYLVVGNGQLRS